MGETATAAGWARSCWRERGEANVSGTQPDRAHGEERGQCGRGRRQREQRTRVGRGQSERARGAASASAEKACEISSILL
jgi:hypothetical protein